MIPRTKWTERKFNFDLPEGWLPNILERLRGTSVRIKDMTSALSDEQAQFKTESKWSIKEHIGHLADLEELHEGRIDDFIDRKELLRAADMSNTKTILADHNQEDIQILIEKFSRNREQLISRLENLDDETQHFRSMHPRLKAMMRPVDMACFTAEHDDHHLASMREIILQIK